jgi:hypothetical protein
MKLMKSCAATKKNYGWTTGYTSPNVSSRAFLRSVRRKSEASADAGCQLAVRFEEMNRVVVLGLFEPSESMGM